MDLTDIAGNSQGFTPRPPDEPKPMLPVEHDIPDPDVKPDTGTQEERNETTHAPTGLWSWDAAIDGRDQVMVSAPPSGEGENNK